MREVGDPGTDPGALLRKKRRLIVSDSETEEGCSRPRGADPDSDAEGRDLAARGSGIGVPKRTDALAGGAERIGGSSDDGKPRECREGSDQLTPGLKRKDEGSREQFDVENAGFCWKKTKNGLLKLRIDMPVDGKDRGKESRGSKLRVGESGGGRKPDFSGKERFALSSGRSRDRLISRMDRLAREGSSGFVDRERGVSSISKHSNMIRVQGKGGLLKVLPKIKKGSGIDLEKWGVRRGSLAHRADPEVAGGNTDGRKWDRYPGKEHGAKGFVSDGVSSKRSKFSDDRNRVKFPTDGVSGSMGSGGRLLSGKSSDRKISASAPGSMTADKEEHPFPRDMTHRHPDLSEKAGRMLKYTKNHSNTTGDWDAFSSGKKNVSKDPRSAVFVDNQKHFSGEGRLPSTSDSSYRTEKLRKYLNKHPTPMSDKHATFSGRKSDTKDRIPDFSIATVTNRGPYSEDARTFFRHGSSTLLDKDKKYVKRSSDLSHDKQDHFSGVGKVSKKEITDIADVNTKKQDNLCGDVKIRDVDDPNNKACKDLKHYKESDIVIDKKNLAPGDKNTSVKGVLTDLDDVQLHSTGNVSKELQTHEKSDSPQKEVVDHRFGIKYSCSHHRKRKKQLENNDVAGFLDEKGDNPSGSTVPSERLGPSDKEYKSKKSQGMYSQSTSPEKHTNDLPSRKKLKNDHHFLNKKAKNKSKSKQPEVSHKNIRLQKTAHFTEKQKLREQIKSMLLDAGWKIDLRQRRSRDYQDSVYVSPQGTGYWSITKAYAVYMENFKVSNKEDTSDVDGADDNKYNASTIKYENSTTAPALLDNIDILKRNVVNKRKSKEKKELGTKDGSSNKKKKRKIAKSSESEVHYPFAKKKKHRRGCTLLARSSDHSSGSDEYKPYDGKRTVLAWMIDIGILTANGKVKYMNKKRTKTMLDGWIRREGICCSCCSKIISVYKFEVHAGSKQQQPYQNIFLEGSDVSLLDCQLLAWEKQEKSEKCAFYFVDSKGDDPNDDTCGICGDGGDLMCCDSCPSTFHLSCLDMKVLPSGDWHCSNCSCKFCKADSCRSSSSSELLSCKQCMEKYHQDCRQPEKKTSEVPINVESFFCGSSCKRIFEQLQTLLGVKNELEAGFSWSIVQRIGNGSSLGTNQSAECNSKIAVAVDVMDECFLPLVDQRSGVNLMHNIVYNSGSNFNRLDFSGFYTFILERGDEMISAASVRIHGVRLAEMPFIGTRSMYRRQGMCRRLLTVIELALSSLNIEKLVIPAISELIQTWTMVFNFKPLEGSLQQEIKFINMLVFPGMGLLEKSLLKKEADEIWSKVGKQVDKMEEDLSLMVEEAHPNSSTGSDWPTERDTCSNVNAATKSVESALGELKGGDVTTKSAQGTLGGLLSCSDLTLGEKIAVESKSCTDKHVCVNKNVVGGESYSLIGGSGQYKSDTPKVNDVMGTSGPRELMKLTVVPSSGETEATSTSCSENEYSELCERTGQGYSNIECNDAVADEDGGAMTQDHGISCPTVPSNPVVNKDCTVKFGYENNIVVENTISDHSSLNVPGECVSDSSKVIESTHFSCQSELTDLKDVPLINDETGIKYNRSIEMNYLLCESKAPNSSNTDLVADEGALAEHHGSSYPTLPPNPKENEGFAYKDICESKMLVEDTKGDGRSLLSVPGEHISCSTMLLTSGVPEKEYGNSDGNEISELSGFISPYCSIRNDAAFCDDTEVAQVIDFSIKDRPANLIAMQLITSGAAEREHVESSKIRNFELCGYLAPDSSNVTSKDAASDEVATTENLGSSSLSVLLNNMVNKDCVERLAYGGKDVVKDATPCDDPLAFVPCEYVSDDMEVTNIDGFYRFSELTNLKVLPLSNSGETSTKSARMNEICGSIAVDSSSVDSGTPKHARISGPMVPPNPIVNRTHLNHGNHCHSPCSSDQPGV